MIEKHQLSEIIEEETEGEEEKKIKFETEVEYLVYQNYFLPSTLINANNSDERRFKRCKVCEIQSEET